MRIGRVRKLLCMLGIMLAWFRALFADPDESGVRARPNQHAPFPVSATITPDGRYLRHFRCHGCEAIGTEEGCLGAEVLAVQWDHDKCQEG